MRTQYKFRIKDRIAGPIPGKPIYVLEHKLKNGKIKNKTVGINALRTLYFDGKIVGVIPEYVKSLLGKERRKKRTKKYHQLPNKFVVEPLDN